LFNIVIAWTLLFEPLLYTAKITVGFSYGGKGIGFGLVCVLSIVWALFGRADSGFGGIAERLQYLQNYLVSDRPAYAFVCDILLLYSIFQPWLIGDNIQNVKAGRCHWVRECSEVCPRCRPSGLLQLLRGTGLGSACTFRKLIM
jgi:hypothetical protein